MAERRVERVALVYQPYKATPGELAIQTRALLERYGRASTLHSAFELTEADASEVDLVITFGGDGTVLRVASWLVEEHASATILPVRMGSLSFLGELHPDELADQLEPYLEGDYWLDERSMLRAQADSLRAVALNDVMVGRGAASRAVRLDVWVDDAEVDSYVADGIILASATGSTGYSLAAGGPVLAPHADVMLLQLVAPHLANLRSLVVPAASEVRVAMHTFQPGVLTVDGHVDYPFMDGQEVTVGKAAERIVFARRGKRSDFFQGLGARLTR